MRPSSSLQCSLSDAAIHSNDGRLVEIGFHHSLRGITSACPAFNTGTDHKTITSMGSGSDFSLVHMQPAHV